MRGSWQTAKGAILEEGSDSESHVRLILPACSSLEMRLSVSASFSVEQSRDLGAQICEKLSLHPISFVLFHKVAVTVSHTYRIPKQEERGWRQRPGRSDDSQEGRAELVSVAENPQKAQRSRGLSVAEDSKEAQQSREFRKYIQALGISSQKESDGSVEVTFHLEVYPTLIFIFHLASSILIR